MALKDFLKDSTICLGVQAETSSDVIRHLGQKLLDAGLVKDSFIEAAILRESTMPTGLPLEGSIHVAIPHTDIIHVNQAGVAMAVLAKPVIFQDMVTPSEAVIVSIVFLMALDQPHAQIEMLSEIADILQNPDLLQRLVDAKEFQDVINAFADVTI